VGDAEVGVLAAELGARKRSFVGPGRQRPDADVIKAAAVVALHEERRRGARRERDKRDKRETQRERERERGYEKTRKNGAAKRGAKGEIRERDRERERIRK
jgi:hypothetical protein